MRRSARAGLITALCLALLQAIAPWTINAQDVVITSAPHRVFLPGIVSSPTPQSNWSIEELAALAEINRQRWVSGCASLQVSNELQLAADRHSNDMARSGTVTHIGSDGSNVTQRAREAGYTNQTTGETVGGGYDTSTAIVGGWMNSPDHRKLLMDCANNDIGIGLQINPSTQYRYYWTAVLGRR